MATIFEKFKQRMGGVFKPALPPQNVSFEQVMQTLVWWGGTTGDVYPNINLASSITDGYQSNASVYSIVSKDATKFGSIPRYLYDKAKKEEKALELYEGSKDLTALLDRPNPYEGQDFFYSKIRTYFKICGEAFIYLNRGDLEPYRFPDGSFDDDKIDLLPVLEMTVLPSERIAIIPDPFNIWGCLGYVWDIGGQRIVLRKNDVVQWKTVSLAFDAGTRAHLRGMPPLQPGAELLAESRAVNRSSRRAAENDGAKAAIFEKSLRAMTPEQQTQLKAVIDRKINNNEVSSSVATIQGDWGILDFSMSSKDQMHIEKKQNILQQLCFLFAVPYEFFDPQTTFANKKEAQKGWITNDIMPACKQLDNEFNRTLLKAFKIDKQAFIASDFTDLPEMQVDYAMMSTALSTAYWLTPNEKREMMGEEAMDEEEMDKVWIPAGISMMDQAAQDDGSEEILQQIANGRAATTGGSNAKIPEKGSGTGLRNGS